MDGAGALGGQGQGLAKRHLPEICQRPSQRVAAAQQHPGQSPPQGEPWQEAGRAASEGCRPRPLRASGTPGLPCFTLLCGVWANGWPPKGLTYSPWRPAAALQGGQGQALWGAVQVGTQGFRPSISPGPWAWGPRGALGWGWREAQCEGQRSEAPCGQDMSLPRRPGP